MLQGNFVTYGVRSEKEEPDQAGAEGMPQGLSLLNLTSAMTRKQAAKLFYQICGALLHCGRAVCPACSCCRLQLSYWPQEFAILAA